MFLKLWSFSKSLKFWLFSKFITTLKLPTTFFYENLLHPFACCPKLCTKFLVFSWKAHHKINNSHVHAASRKAPDRLVPIMRQPGPSVSVCRRRFGRPPQRMAAPNPVIKQKWFYCSASQHLPSIDTNCVCVCVCVWIYNLKQSSPAGVNTASPPTLGQVYATGLPKRVGHGHGFMAKKRVSAWQKQHSIRARSVAFWWCLKMVNEKCTHVYVCGKCVCAKTSSDAPISEKITEADRSKISFDISCRTCSGATGWPPSSTPGCPSKVYMGWDGQDGEG